MQISSRFLPLLLAPLAACGPGPDVADNIPQVGQWSDESKVTSVSLDGTAVSVDEFPELRWIKKFNRPAEEFCGEPYFRTAEEIQELINRRDEGECIIKSADHRGASVFAQGTCTGLNDSKTNGSSAISITAFLRPDRIESKEQQEIFIRSNETDEGGSMKFVVRRTMTRLGDC